MNIKDILDDFSVIDKVNYLNTASIGLVPNTVIETAQDFFIELSRCGTLALDEEKESLVYDNLGKRELNF